MSSKKQARRSQHLLAPEALLPRVAGTSLHPRPLPQLPGHGQDVQRAETGGCQGGRVPDAERALQVNLLINYIELSASTLTKKPYRFLFTEKFTDCFSS